LASKTMERKREGKTTAEINFIGLLGSGAPAFATSSCRELA
jgi:hypothetical protein